MEQCEGAQGECQAPTTDVGETVARNMEVHDETAPDTTGASVTTQQQQMLDLNAFIDRDIASRMQRQSWKQMDLCFKWKLIQEYMQGLEIPCEPNVISELRGLLRSNELCNVEYDGSKVVRLNYNDM